jgi:hypothetical protein
MRVYRHELGINHTTSNAESEACTRWGDGWRDPKPMSWGDFCDEIKVMCREQQGKAYPSFVKKDNWSS